MSSSTKPLIAAGTLLLVAAVGYTNVYLPLYSDHGKARREEYERTGKVAAVVDAGAGQELNKKSMWSQLDRGVKGAQQGFNKPPP